MKEQLLRSLFLPERQSLLSKNEIIQSFSKQKGKEALEDWFQFALIHTESKRKAKLEALGIDEPTFGALIQTTRDLEWDERCLPAIKEYHAEWLSVLEEALEINRQLPITMERRSIELLIRPFLLWANARLENILVCWDAQEKYIDHARLIASVIPHLSSELCSIAGRSFVLELHIAKTLQKLQGDTTEQRFVDFVNKYIVDGNKLQQFYSEYAIVSRTLTERTMMFVTVMEELVSRFIHDWGILKETFHLEETPLIAIDSKGDSHKEGRTVMHLHLGSGQSFMYKPKSLAVSQAFQSLLGWINSKGFHPTFKTISVINRDEYGYEAFVEAKDCENKDQIRNFYRRLGAYLGIASMLEGADFHYENIIACGEHPMLIDLETLFHNQVRQDIPDSADVEAQCIIQSSPIGTSLLPSLLFLDEKGLGIDISGLNGGEQFIPSDMLNVVDINTDNMRYIRTQHTTPVSHNLPSCNGLTITPDHYVTEIVDGYRDINNLFMKHRDQMLGYDGLLTMFSNVPIRIILRSTQSYMNVLLELRHPDYGRDALDFERLLDRMWFSWLDDRLIASEIKDLRAGDIPYFFSFPDSHHLWDSHGQRIDNVFGNTAMDKIKQKLSSLNHNKIEGYGNWIAESIIGSSLSKKAHAVESEATVMGYPSKVETASSAQFVNGALRIGEQLIGQAIWSQNRKMATWIGLNPNYLGQLNISSLSGGVYEGTGGISLFLAHLYRITQEQRFKQCAWAAFESTINKFPMTVKFPSAFYGQASVLYVMAQFESIVGQRKTWKQHRLHLLDNLQQNVKQDTFYDLLGGAAGVIHVLLNESSLRGSNREIKIASMYGDHLLKHVQKSSKGFYWKSSVFSEVYVGLEVR